jgi:hypothetical protein
MTREGCLSDRYPEVGECSPICLGMVLDCRQQWDNRPIYVYANNCKSPDLVRVRGVLYYSSAGFFLLQLEQACSYLPSV